MVYNIITYNNKIYGIKRLPNKVPVFYRNGTDYLFHIYTPRPYTGIYGGHYSGVFRSVLVRYMSHPVSIFLFLFSNNVKIAI